MAAFGLLTAVSDRVIVAAGWLLPKTSSTDRSPTESLGGRLSVSVPFLLCDDEAEAAEPREMVFRTAAAFFTTLTRETSSPMLPDRCNSLDLLSPKVSASRESAKTSNLGPRLALEEELNSDCCQFWLSLMASAFAGDSADFNLAPPFFPAPDLLFPPE
jgi:hypothetical protein